MESIMKQPVIFMEGLNMSIYPAIYQLIKRFPLLMAPADLLCVQNKTLLLASLIQSRPTRPISKILILLSQEW
jgi:hypothetical protein